MSAAPRAAASSTSLRPIPTHPPKILSNLLGDDDDVQRLIAGCRTARAIFESNAFEPYYEGACLPDAEVQSDVQFESYIRGGTGPAYHPVGTCKMGTDDQAVVDRRPTARARHGSACAWSTPRSCRRHQRQHQRPDHHDRREGRRSGS